MKLGQSARYALHAAIEMARSPDRPVTVGAVAARLSIPSAALAKIFQQLVRAGVARGARGAGGGYRLSRPPSVLSALDVIVPFGPPPPPDQCLSAGRDDARCPEGEACGVRRLLDETDELVRTTFASVSLKTLAGRGEAPRRTKPRR